jgi:hypothetical protein
MTPISEIKEAVVTALQAVPSIGNVYPRRRFAATDSALYSIYKNAQTGDLRAFHDWRIIEKMRTSEHFLPIFRRAKQGGRAVSCR